jgi:hypothetical protein
MVSSRGLGVMNTVADEDDRVMPRHRTIGILMMMRFNGLKN